MFPGATDTWYDGIDSDCAGDNDYDFDTHGQPNTTYGGTDCNDFDSTIYLGATDTWGDGVDNDCSGGSDYDQDGDGFDSTSTVEMTVMIPTARSIQLWLTVGK